MQRQLLRTWVGNMPRKGQGSYQGQRVSLPISSRCRRLGRIFCRYALRLIFSYTGLRSRMRPADSLKSLSTEGSSGSACT